MGVMYIAPRTCEKGWLGQTFSKRCATNNKYTKWVFVIGIYYIVCVALYGNVNKTRQTID